MVSKGRLQKKKHMAGEKYGVARKRTGEGAMRNKMRNESIMRENNRKTMRNTSVSFYFS